MKKASSRKWFYEISDWIQFEEVEDVDDRARSYFEIQEAQHGNPTQENESTEVKEVPSVSAKLVDQSENVGSANSLKSVKRSFISAVESKP